MSELIISVHVPKTGGASFRALLEQHAQGHIVWDYHDRPLAPGSRVRRAIQATRRADRVPEGTRVVHGHFVASKYSRRYPDAIHAMWFRDPVQRLVSHYHYWRREPDLENATCRKLIEDDLTLREFAELPEMSDVHERFLGGVPLRELAFVGITERFDESLDLFRRRFCPDLGLSPVQLNANPERAADGYEIAAADKEAIVRHNRADLELYRRALDRFDELLGV